MFQTSPAVAGTAGTLSVSRALPQWQASNSSIPEFDTVRAPWSRIQKWSAPTDRLHILPWVRRRGYHVPSEGTVDSGCLRRTLRMVRRADCSRTREEHSQASKYLWEPGFLPNFSFSYLLCRKSRNTRQIMPSYRKHRR